MTTTRLAAVFIQDNTREPVPDKKSLPIFVGQVKSSQVKFI